MSARRVRSKNQHRGIENPEDLRANCDVDPITGCWLWKGPRTKDGTAHVWAFHRQKGVTTSISGGRAAWYLEGLDVPPGHIVYRPECKSKLCVLRTHWECATKRDAFKVERPPTPKKTIGKAWGDTPMSSDDIEPGAWNSGRVASIFHLGAALL